jgi:pseudoazurin
MSVFKFLSLSLLSCYVQFAFATEHTVKGVVTKWKPMITFAQPGDTIRFVGMIGHNTVTINGMIPDGAEGWESKYGDEGYTVTVEQEGAYIFKCTPHITTGMVGAIVVGDTLPPANLEVVDANVSKVTIGKSMVKRTIKKMKKAISTRADG